VLYESWSCCPPTLPSISPEYTLVSQVPTSRDAPYQTAWSRQRPTFGESLGSITPRWFISIKGRAASKSMFSPQGGQSAFNEDRAPPLPRTCFEKASDAGRSETKTFRAVDVGCRGPSGSGIVPSNLGDLTQSLEASLKAGNRPPEATAAGPKG
jgi:hypothetical protein